MSAARGVELADQAKKKPLHEGLRIGAGTMSRTRDLLITSLCNNLRNSISYEIHFHKKLQKHPCFISVLDLFIHRFTQRVKSSFREILIFE